MRKRILIVDDEEDLVFSLERRLAAAIPNLDVTAVCTSSAALEAIHTQEFSLVISDVRMPGLSGLELLLRARQIWPALPFLIMTAFPTEAVKRETQTPGVHYLEKPFSIQALVAKVTDALAVQENPGFSGAVSSATLPDLIQLFFMSGSTGALRVWHGSDTGAIWFDAGAIRHALAGAKVGRDAVFELVAWEGGRFAMELGMKPPAEATITEGTTGLVLEALRRADEHRHQRGPPGSEAQESNSDDIQWISEDIIVLDDSGDEHEPNGTNPNSGDTTMPNNVSVTLEKLRTIDGYVGSCVVDSESAMSLGSDGGSGMNLDVAAAGNAEVVKAKRKVMRALGLKDEIEDILISLGKAYHLIRPLRGRPGVFIYVALERSRANLAMARMTVADAEKTLEI